MSPVVTLTLFATFLLVLIVPGQDFVTVLRLSVSRSRRVGIAAAGGSATGLLIWALASVTGVSALLDDDIGLSRALRVGGASLLAAFGVYSVIHALVARPHPVEVVGGPGRGPGYSVFRGWSTGLLSNLSNVKILVFFSSLFSGLLPDGLGTIDITLIAVLMALLAFGWFSVVAVFGSHPRISRIYLRARRGIDIFFGAVFIVLGTVLLAA